MKLSDYLERARARRSAKKQLPTVGSDADWAMVRLTKAIVRSTIVSAVIGVLAVVFAGLQWLSQRDLLDFAERQFAYSQKQAAQSAKETQAALKISDRVASATESLVGVNRDQATLSNKQLAQGRDFFTAQQRPIIDLDMERGKFDFGFNGRAFGWNYNFKNIGLGAARYLIIRESLSVFGKPAQTSMRAGQDFMSPGGTGDSTAMYVPSQQDLKSSKPAVPRIRVTFFYRDQFGNKLQSGFCRYLGEDGRTIYVC